MDFFINLNQIYDKWIGETVDIIAIKSGESKDIILTNFNIKDKTHLYILEVAKIFAPFLGKKVFLDSETIGIIAYFKNSKIIGEVPRKKDAVSAGLINVEDIFKELERRGGPTRNIYEKIYEDYYMPPTKKQIKELKKKEKNNEI